VKGGVVVDDNGSSSTLVLATRVAQVVVLQEVFINSRQIISTTGVVLVLAVLATIPG
jgi:hypothetical protein